MPYTRTRARTRRQTPDGFEQRLLVGARDAGFTSADRIVIGFSGGRDSLALAARCDGFMRRSASSRCWSTSTTDCGNHLQKKRHGAASLAESLNLECQVVAVSTSPTDVHAGVGMEEAARRERYRSLFAVARRRGASAVATAHHRGPSGDGAAASAARGRGARGGGDGGALTFAHPGHRPSSRHIPGEPGNPALAVAAILERAARGHPGLCREAWLNADRGPVQHRYDVAA